MDIDQYSYAEGPDIYYDEDFRATIEAHIYYLRNHEETKILYLEPHILYRYEFDMYGMLIHYNALVTAYSHSLTFNATYAINTIYNAGTGANGCFSFSADRKTIYWYNSTNAANQLNASGATVVYEYVAIG